ncbi:MAG: tRNA preQ1(34) S-adenosylmethionine ribosyltransferase-isomerase QueA [Acidobacteria bacterium]|nr:tRNA preQ1(34) S-adenosylmethionine ribosyltransferase-isomerase QueA [Acidobacteriota bacterium]
MKRSDFSYELPAELIAQTAGERGTSRMLVVRPETGALEHRSIVDFPSELNPDDLVVLNDTRVIPARLFADPLPGMERRIEILLARDRGDGVWEALAKPARRIGEGDVLRFSADLTARVITKLDRGRVVVAFEKTAEELLSLIETVGRAPLPPYIRRDATDADRERYQTVYASAPGAVAAPTAGLHFTDDILAAIRKRGIPIERVTLHVGLGTFRPVEAENIQDHVMDVERFEIPESTAEAVRRAKAAGGRVVAIGTTTVRALESAADEEGRLSPGRSETGIFIVPGYSFRVVDALLTNFHLPESTLLMLVSAFAGVETIRHAYREAIARRYRFYSYGDCMFIERGGS